MHQHRHIHFAKQFGISQGAREHCKIAQAGEIFIHGFAIDHKCTVARVGGVDAYTSRGTLATADTFDITSKIFHENASPKALLAWVFVRHGDEQALHTHSIS